MKEIRFDTKSDCRLGNIGFISVLRNSGHTVEYKTGKERFSFIYVEKGALEYSFYKTGKTVTLEKNSFLYVPKNFPYKAVYTKDNTHLRVIIFDILTDEVPLYLDTPVLKKSVETSSVFSSFSGGNVNNTLFLSSKIYELLYIIENEGFKIPKKYKKIAPAINELQQQYFENKKLSYYSDLCNMSESNFRKLFKEYTGKSPIDYRNSIRIFEVKKLIDSGEFTITEAAYLTGFNNMSFFYNLYNKYK